MNGMEMEPDVSISRWEEFRRQLSPGHQRRSSSIISEIRSRLITDDDWIQNIQHQAEKQVKCAAEQIGRDHLLQLMLNSGLHSENQYSPKSSNSIPPLDPIPDEVLNSATINLPVIPMRSCTELFYEGIHADIDQPDLDDDYLQLFVQYSRSTSLSRTIRYWRRYSTLRRRRRSALDKLLLIRMFRRWRCYGQHNAQQPTVPRSGYQLRPSRRCPLPAPVPRLQLNQMYIRGHQLHRRNTSRSLTSRSTPSLPVLPPVQSNRDIHIPKAPPRPKSAPFVRFRRHARSKSDSDLNNNNNNTSRSLQDDSEFSKHETRENKCNNKIEIESSERCQRKTSECLIAVDREATAAESQQTSRTESNNVPEDTNEDNTKPHIDSTQTQTELPQLESEPEHTQCNNEDKKQISEAVRLYRYRLKLGRIHYYRSLLIDNGWRPWRCLIELQHRLYQHAQYQYRNMILRRGIRCWTSRLQFNRKQITIAIVFHRYIVCRHAYRTWMLAILQTRNQMQILQAKLAIRRWFMFVKERHEEYERMGIQPKIRTHWRRWRRIYQESRRNQYRQDMLLKVEAWLQADHLPNILS